MAIEEKIQEALSGSLENLGYEIVQIKYHKGENSSLQIMIDKSSEGSIGLDDCTKVSRIVSTIMDVEDFISDQYNLEVSSPGINRPLIKQKDFLRFEGRNVQFRLKEPYNGSKNFKGKMKKVDGKKVSFGVEGIDELSVDIEDIESANLL